VKFVATCLGLLATFLPLCRAAEPTLVNGVEVIVGDAIITRKDIQAALQEDFEALEQRYRGQPKIISEKAAQLEKDKVEDLVERQLILQEFKRFAAEHNTVIPESYIQSRINEDIRRYGDRLTLTKTLQAEGTTFETYRNKIRERIILEVMWHNKVPNDPLISPAKIEKYYLENKDKFKVEDQIKYRTILLTNRPNDIAYSPKRMAAEITAKLDEGVPFDDLARIYSQESQAADGGNKGWVQRSALLEDLAQVAFNLKAGEHSAPIETSRGVFIIQVEEARVSYTKTLVEARDEIEATLRAQEMARLRKQWIEQLKSKAFVRYFF
jgi:peptidyl-prolyl cis-trans isomerase SurA